ncbi:MAG: hypothetical protein JSS34_00980 [Proteobacteria bacterium]|nr:hypothetical protein [Pseudomonadota bacterium]
MKFRKIIPLSFKVLFLSYPLLTVHGMELPDISQAQDATVLDERTNVSSFVTFDSYGEDNEVSVPYPSHPAFSVPLNYYQGESFLQGYARNNYNFVDFDGIKNNAHVWQEFVILPGQILFSTNRKEKLKAFLKGFSPEERKALKVKVYKRSWDERRSELNRGHEVWIRNNVTGGWLLISPNDVDGLVWENNKDGKERTDYTVQVEGHLPSQVVDQWHLGRGREGEDPIKDRSYNNWRYLLEADGKAYAFGRSEEGIYDTNRNAMVDLKKGKIIISEGDWRGKFKDDLKVQSLNFPVVLKMKDEANVRQKLDKQQISYSIQPDGYILAKLERAKAVRFLTSSEFRSKIELIEMPEIALQGKETLRPPMDEKQEKSIFRTSEGYRARW